MNRRDLLGALGSSIVVGTAGCLSVNAGGMVSRGGSRDDQTPGSETAVTVSRTSSISEVPVEYDMEVTRSSTRDTPSLLRTRIQNTGREAVFMGDRRIVKNQGVKSDRSKLLLYPSEDFRTSDSGDCWGVDEYSTGFDFQGMKLESGEQLSSRSFVVGWSHESKYCVPPGKHQFYPDINGAMSPEALVDGENALDWSFTLRVETTD